MKKIRLMRKLRMTRLISDRLRTVNAGTEETIVFGGLKFESEHSNID